MHALHAGDDIMGWITAQTWDKLKPDVDAACATAKSQGASKLACIGFCWGVSIAMSAGAVRIACALFSCACMQVERMVVAPC